MAVRQVYYNGENALLSNRCIESVPIIINDAGEEFFYAPFTSWSTRKDFGLVYVLKGEMRFGRDNKETVIKDGGFLIGPPHEEETSFGTDGDFLNYYWLNFTGSMAAELIKDMGLEYNHGYHVGAADEISKCFRKIFQEFHINDKFYAKRSEAALIMLLSTVARCIQGTSKKYLKSVDYIHNHYNEDISIEFLASLEKFSYSRYHDIFKDMMGMSPQEYIINQRINTSCYYLLESAYSIGEIAELTGYEDQCYFSRIFKKKMGITPQQYRKNKGENK